MPWRTEPRNREMLMEDAGCNPTSRPESSSTTPARSPEPSSEHAQPIALLTTTFVAAGGRRAKSSEPGAVRVLLMNVLRYTATDFDTRRRLLEATLRWAADQSRAPTIVLAPAGYFGWDTVTGSGRASLPAGDGTAAQALTYLRSRALSLPPNLLLAVGVDHAVQTLQVLGTGPPVEIIRHRSSVAERTLSFAGLKLFFCVCGEVLPNQGPIAPSVDFSEQRDLAGVDALLCAAHIEVKSTQQDGADTGRFPFETMLTRVSQAGAAGFLAHHHPAVRSSGGWPRNDSYSDWGIFAKTGAGPDWLRYQDGRWLREDELDIHRLVLA